MGIAHNCTAGLAFPNSLFGVRLHQVYEPLVLLPRHTPAFQSHAILPHVEFGQLQPVRQGRVQAQELFQPVEVCLLCLFALHELLILHHVHLASRVRCEPGLQRQAVINGQDMIIFACTRKKICLKMKILPWMDKNSLPERGGNTKHGSASYFGMLYLH